MPGCFRIARAASSSLATTARATWQQPRRCCNCGRRGGCPTRTRSRHTTPSTRLRCSPAALRSWRLLPSMRSAARAAPSGSPPRSAHGRWRSCGADVRRSRRNMPRAFPRPAQLGRTRPRPQRSPCCRARRRPPRLGRSRSRQWYGCCHRARRGPCPQYPPRRRHCRPRRPRRRRRRRQTMAAEFVMATVRRTATRDFSTSRITPTWRPSWQRPGGSSGRSARPSCRR
mmetsp:Transcript_106765/g.307087  ORF Transcript_106765/g.307087 Transcript_106765/m.307087 type:complete len:228 (-) Transcript_106765:94-777(-)